MIHVQKRVALIFFRGSTVACACDAILDPGADHSVVDASIGQLIGVDESSPITLNQVSTSTDAMMSDPVSLVALFMGTSQAPMYFQHSFIVTSMNKDSQDGAVCLIGMDLIPLLFPDHVPTDFLSVNRSSSLPNPVALPSLSVGEGVASASISFTSTSTDILATIRALSATERKVINDLPALEGYHDLVPPPEKPVRLSVSQDPSAKDYSREREATLLKIRDLLEENAAITGFCTHPEAVIKLEVDEEKFDKKYRPQYRIPDRLIPYVTAQIQKWLADGRIKVADRGTEYNNPLTCAPKKDDFGGLTGVRTCLDTRAVNVRVKSRDMHPIPGVKDILHRMATCILFGEFDLSDAYLQFLLHESSQKYTAFTWDGIQYVFVGCIYGLSPIPNQFQRIMSRIFMDLSFVRPYLDNLPFGSHSVEEHVEHIILIIERLNKWNLRLKPSAMKIFMTSMQCLGHMITYKGISLDPNKQKALPDIPFPATCKAMRSFLGVCGYLRDHVRHFADLAAPLEAVKNTPNYTVTDIMRRHFELLKRAIQAAPMICFPSPDCPYRVATDASNTGIGGVLYQPQVIGEGMTPHNIVAICSKSLCESRRKYPAYKKELWAIVYCLRQFHAYIWGRHFTLETDHRPLIYMLISPELNNTMEQWLDVILNYDFDIEHRPGILNVLPDALSRLYDAAYDEPERPWGVDSCRYPLPKVVVDKELGMLDDTDRSYNVMASLYYAHAEVAKAVVEKHHSFMDKTTSAGVRLATTRRQTAREEFAQRLVLPKQTPSLNPPVLMDTPSSTTTITPWPSIGTATEVGDNDIKKEEDDSTTPPEEDEVPSESVAAPVQMNGTQEAMQVLDSITLWRPNGKEDEAKLLVEMEKRGMSAPAHHSDRMKLIEQEHALGHFGRKTIFRSLYKQKFWWPNIHRDIKNVVGKCDACLRFNVGKPGFHPIQSINSTGPGQHFQIDLSTGYPESTEGYVALLHVIDVYSGFIMLVPLKDKTAHAVAQALFDLFMLVGVPKWLQSDNGPEFISDVLSALKALLGARSRFIAAYNPRADGKVERSIGTVKSVIFKLLQGADHFWPLYVSFAQYVYNVKLAEITSVTPFFVFFGREHNSLLDYTRNIRDDVKVEPTSLNMDEWKEHNEKVMSVIYPALDERVKTVNQTLRAKVNKHRRTLLESFPVGATVMLLDPHRKNKSDARYIGPYSIVRRTYYGTYILRDATGDILDRHVPSDQLKLTTLPPLALDPQNNIYTIRRIVKHRGMGADLEYLIQWVGYREKDWVKQKDLLDIEVVRSYWDRVNKKDINDKPKAKRSRKK